MAIKTFNVDEEIYKEFSAHCKKNGISMSKRVENFLKEEVSRIKSKILVSKNKLVSEKKDAVSHVGSHSFSKYC